MHDLMNDDGALIAKCSIWRLIANHVGHLLVEFHIEIGGTYNMCVDYCLFHAIHNEKRGSSNF